MSYRLGCFPTSAISVWYIRHSALVQVVPEPYLSRAHLYDYCAECPMKALVYLQNFLCRGGRQLVYRLAIGAGLPVLFPLGVDYLSDP